jgi:uncharacterized protein (DUF58 family)
MATENKQPADDIVRVNQSTLIALHRDAHKLPLKSRKIQSRMSGHYLSAFKGRGMEFDEARPYQPGDDIRSIDWRVTARTGKTHTKLFREERERPVLLWVDYRKPMFFGTRNSFKSVLAAKIAALLAWSAAQHGDRLGGLIFSEQLHQELRPQRGKSASLHFIQKLTEHPAWDNFSHTDDDETSGIQALQRLRRVARPGSLIFLISDFRHMEPGMQAVLSTLARHNDIVMLFIHDPLEHQLPPAGFYRVSDGDRELTLDTRNKNNRQLYQQRFAQHREQLHQLCNKLGIFFLDISTEHALLERLQKGLGLRKGL